MSSSIVRSKHSLHRSADEDGPAAKRAALGCLDNGPNKDEQTIKTEETGDIDDPLEPVPTAEVHSPQPAADNKNDHSGHVLSSFQTIQSDPTNPANFNDYLFALLSFRSEHGNFSVHKEEHPQLYSFLVHVKREYSRHTHLPTAATLTREQCRVLEFLHVPLTHRGDDHWNRFFGMLEHFKARHGHVLVPRVCEVPGLGDWVTDQRRQYKAWKQGKTNQMTKDRKDKLDALGFTWQVRNRPEWDQRFQELVEYKSLNGDCKVPQHYRENKALGKWVAKQREQWKLKQKGQHSFLTPDREEKLNDIGFQWSIRTGTGNSMDEEPALNEPGLVNAEAGKISETTVATAETGDALDPLAPNKQFGV